MAPRNSRSSDPRVQKNRLSSLHRGSWLALSSSRFHVLADLHRICRYIGWLLFGDDGFSYTALHYSTLVGWRYTIFDFLFSTGTTVYLGSCFAILTFRSLHGVGFW